MSSSLAPTRPAVQDRARTLLDHLARRERLETELVRVQRVERRLSPGRLTFLTAIHLALAASGGWMVAVLATAPDPSAADPPLLAAFGLLVVAGAAGSLLWMFQERRSARRDRLVLEALLALQAASEPAVESPELP